MATSIVRPPEIQAPDANSLSIPPKNATVKPLFSKSTTGRTESLRVPYESEIFRRLAARFAGPPFRVERVDPRRPELIIAYSGGLGRYVMCGEAVGMPNPNGSARLNSRLVVRLADGASGSAGLSVDASHIVSLSGRAPGSLDLLNVSPGKPARAQNGEYCWSTGEMERLVRMQ
jgi:hypothetical protein